MKNTKTGDTLCDPDNPIVLESLEFPAPVIHVAVEPKTKADQEKMGKALQSLAEEDPTFTGRTDEDTGKVIIAGMGVNGSAAGRERGSQYRWKQEVGGITKK